MNKFILLSAILFVISMFGMFLARQHLIIILMSLEILSLSANINFVIFSQVHDEILGQLFALIILTVGAAESAIGLSILIVYYRLRGVISVDSIQVLKG